MSARVPRTASIAAAIALGAVAVTSAQAPKPTDSYDELFLRYLQEAQSAKPAPASVQAWAWMSGLSLDRRASSHHFRQADPPGFVHRCDIRVFPQESAQRIRLRVHVRHLLHLIKERRHRFRRQNQQISFLRGRAWE